MYFVNNGTSIGRIKVDDKVYIKLISNFKLLEKCLSAFTPGVQTLMIKKTPQFA